MKKKYLLSAFLLISLSSVLAQDLDEAFLESLPEDVQEDIYKNIEDQKDIDSPIYKSINSKTQLEKKNLADLKKRIEADLLLLEEIIENKDDPIKQDDLILFGSDFFKTYQSSFMPINEPNLSSDYILDLCDTLEIQLTGQ